MTVRPDEPPLRAEEQTPAAAQVAPQRQSPWIIGITLIIAIGLLFLALRGIDWDQFISILKNAAPLPLMLAFVVLSLSYTVRSARWNMLLSIERQLPILSVFWAVSAGYLGNYFLPARAGEVIRSALVSRFSRLSTSYVLATALTERLVDLVALVLMSVIGLFWIANLPDWLQLAARVMAVVGLAGLVVLVVLPRLERRLGNLLALLPLPAEWQQRLLGLLAQFLLGMRAIQNRGRALRFSGLTVVIWLLDAVVAILVASALQLSLGLPQALVLLAALGLSSAAPSTPGFLGIFQFVAVTVLAPFGFGRSEALAFIVAFQAITYLNVTIWGLLGLWRLGAGQKS